YILTALVLLIYVLIIPFHGTVWKFITTAKWDNIGALNHGFQRLSPFFALQEELYPSVSFSSNSISLVNPFFLLGLSAKSFVRLGSALADYLLLNILLSVLFLWVTIHRVRRIVYESHSISRPVPEEEEEWSPVYERDYDLQFAALSES